MNTLTNVDSRQAQVQNVLNAVESNHTRRAYERALNEFLDWHTSQGQPALTKAIVNQYKRYLQDAGKSASVINQALSAIRKLVREAADNGAIEHVHAQGIANVKSVKVESTLTGRDITDSEITLLLETIRRENSSLSTRDSAILAMLYACGLRRQEVVKLDLENYNPETGELRIVGSKRNKSRELYIDNGAKTYLDRWLEIRGNQPGPLFIQIRKGDHLKYNRLTTQAIHYIVTKYAESAGIENISPHDFRRTCIGNLLDNGVDIATVARMVGHSDVNQTAKYDRRKNETLRRAAKTLHVPVF